MPPSAFYTSFGIFVRRSVYLIFNRHIYPNRHFYVQSAFLCPIGIMFDLRAFCNQSATDDTSMHGCAPIVECMACDSGMCYTGVRACRRVCVLFVCACVCVCAYVCLFAVPSARPAQNKLANVHTCTHAHVSACTCKRTHVHAHIRMMMRAYTHANVHAHMRTCVQTGRTNVSVCLK